MSGAWWGTLPEANKQAACATADNRRPSVARARTSSPRSSKGPMCTIVFYLQPDLLVSLLFNGLAHSRRTDQHHCESFQETLKMLEFVSAQRTLPFSHQWADLLLWRLPSAVCVDPCCLQGAALMADSTFNCFLLFNLFYASVIMSGSSSAAHPSVVPDFSLFAWIIRNFNQRRTLIKSFLIWHYWERDCDAVTIS